MSELAESGKPTAMQLIPALDLYEGKAVRLHQGDYDKVTVYADDPCQPLLAFAEAPEVSLVHIVDLEGARRGEPVQHQLIGRIVDAIGSVKAQVGGGIRTTDAVSAYFDAGASRVVLGSSAVHQLRWVEEVAEHWPGRIVIAVDARGGLVATHGWEQTSTIRALDLVDQLRDLPLAGILYTDVARDGTQAGPNVQATTTLAAATSHPVLASGGVGSLDHVRQLAAEPSIAGAIVGRALYEKNFSVQQAVEAIALTIGSAGRAKVVAPDENV